MKANYVVYVAFGRCGYAGHCTGGTFGYTCANGKSYCCPASVVGDPPASSIWQATAENPQSCTEQPEEEFPFPGILVTPGVGPDPERGSVLGTAPWRF